MIAWRNRDRLNSPITLLFFEFSAVGAQPISLKLLKGLGRFPARFCEMTAEKEFHKMHEWVPSCTAC